MDRIGGIRVTLGLTTEEWLDMLEREGLLTMAQDGVEPHEPGDHDAAYLGDGLYVSHDDWQIRLHTDRMGITHEVFLEPEVLEAFLKYVSRFKENRTR